MFASWMQSTVLYSVIQNFSPFYICSVAVSVAAVICTWYFSRSNGIQPHPESTNFPPEMPLNFEKDGVHSCDFNVVRQMKLAKEKVIEKILTEDLSDEQLQLEKEIERKQLSEIFKLLREQEEKFLINSEEEFHEQLKMYKSQ